MNKLIKKISLIAALLIGQQTFAASTMGSASALIKARLSTPKTMCSDKLRCASPLLAKFYQQHNFAPVWLSDDEPSDEALKFITTLQNSYQDGLDPRSYHTLQITALLDQLDQTENTKKRNKLLANLDLTLTDAFFLYANNLHYGILSSHQLFPDWTAGPKPVNLINGLSEGLSDSSLDEIIKGLAPHYTGYQALKTKMNLYQQIAIAGGWESIPSGDTLQLGDSDERVSLIQQRLLVSGELSSIDSKGEFTKNLQKAVIQFQENNGLFDDGIVESDTLAALNIPVSERIRLMEMNLDKMRWLPQNLGSEYIMVNLPEYSLNVIKDGKPTMTMDVAVGGSEHPSCVLSSKITSVVLNPYWTMPTGIAATELWPHLKSEKGFLAKKHVQVLKKNAKGEYSPIDANNFNWNKMTAQQFNSYLFRQDPGVGNSLGKVKFMFANPCQIYLHDTNESEVFDIYRRDFSHGCIRLGEPQNLTNYVLGKEDGWTKKKVAKTFKNGQVKTVNLANPLNLYIVYFTSWVSNDDWVQFRSDIYSLDKAKKYAVYLPPQAEAARDVSDSDKQDTESK